MAIRYRCSTCKKMHTGLPDLGFASPHQYEGLSKAERRKLAKLSHDFCQIEDDRFIRAVLDVPIVGTNECFGWGVWVSLSQRNFDRYAELFHEDPPAGEGPYFGWLCNQVPSYPDTLNLKTQVHLRSAKHRPRIELEPTDHPLAVHQREGISLADLLARIGDRLHSS